MQLSKFNLPSGKQFFLYLASSLLAMTLWVVSPNALASDNPELLPEQPTPIIDLANILTSAQEEKLISNIEQLEEETGWKLRVMTQYDRSPGVAVREFWDLNDKSILTIADPRGGNLLGFNVGLDVYEFLPRTFWVELQTRYGNQFYVRDNGEDAAILDSLQSIESCLRDGGCQVVPGLPKEQWILTLITSAIGGLVFGFAAHPRKKGQIIAWQWALIFSPLWSILFVAFGIGPVVSRTADWLPLVRNILAFLIGALAAYLAPGFGKPDLSESET